MNPDAGSGNHDRDEMVARVERYAERVRVVDPKSWRVHRALKDGTEMIVAGGDGSVGMVARAVTGSSIPVHIIPTGTANNIAQSLGIVRRETNLDNVLSDWTLTGVNAIECGREIAIESVGCGAIAQLIRDEPDVDRSTLPAERKKLRQLIEEVPAFEYELTLDQATRRTGKAVLIEVLVMPQIGPRVVLARKATYAGATLAIVVVHANERERLTRFLGTQTGSRAMLRTIRATNVTITCDAPWHIDDDPRRARKRTLRLIPAGWRVFVPKKNAGA